MENLCEPLLASVLLLGHRNLGECVGSFTLKFLWQRALGQVWLHSWHGLRGRWPRYASGRRDSASDLPSRQDHKKRGDLDPEEPRLHRTSKSPATVSLLPHKGGIFYAMRALFDQILLLSSQLNHQCCKIDYFTCKSYLSTNWIKEETKLKTA